MRLSRYFLVAGAAVAAAGGVTYLLARRNRDRAESEPDPRLFFAGWDRVVIERDVAYGAYAVGGVAIATGLVLALTARGHGDGPQLSAAPAPGGAVLTMAWAR
jgi:hypothetical protein